ncbi:TPA: type-F conjugative transfer system mating-pair stabilization protein TraN [Escherichia coli]|uniref:type-F conjugative transfer system mating-pair stabilization protein TraN n=1 Tax=Escherichia coli TaxID=562 RepID=UPI0021D654F7|nr:type-F conjugative transfer system mating-pair stabilization protein TraN [Escherichia coli]MCU7734264.1 type-F conjugative transfer system mating-pair stabilization protein TraN [Escherichia coli]
MKRAIVMVLAALVTFGTGLQASDKYTPGKQFTDSLKGSGTGVLNNFRPDETIPGYTENPPETGHYGGVTSSGSASLENAGAGALNNSEVGKLTSEVIMNRPKDPISMDAPFLSGGFDIQDKADIITNGTYDKCEAVNVNKTEITSHVCERTPAVELACTRKAQIGSQWQEGIVSETHIIPHEKFRFWREGKRIAVSYSAPVSGTVQRATLNIVTQNPLLNSQMTLMNTTFNVTWTETVKLNAAGMVLTKGQVVSGIGCSANGTCLGKVDDMVFGYLTSGQTRWTLTLVMQVKSQVQAPKLEWVESCPFDKSEEVLQGSQCTEAGGNRVVVIGGKNHTVYSDCWAWKDTYLNQEADNGSCDVYMKNPACTVSRTTCQEKSGSACLQEEVTFSCEKKVSGEAQLCSGQLVCANGECDAIENNTSDGFDKAVSALAAVTAAAKDVAAMNDVNVRAFTGKPMECRMAIAGFSNCCKDSGWGQGIGLAHCDSEEKALGKAKEKLLTVYVGTYCSKKALGVCLQKKKAYCQFDSKLAQIVQSQGRKGQLGIGFGSGKSPDCRGITVDELQALKFDRMDFSNFYSDLNAGTTIPSDSELAERVKEQVASALQQSAGKGQ